MKKKIAFIISTLIMSLSLPLLSYASTFSEYWYQDSQGNWHIQDQNGNMVTNAWLCDDAVASNSQDIWYLIDSNGNMVSAGLVQDQTGNIYSIETSHNGFYGMLRYQSGTYDGVYLDLESSHNGGFSRLKNQDGINGLQGIYGLTQVNIDNSNCVYTSSFKVESQNLILDENGKPKFENVTIDENGKYKFKKEHPDDKVIVNGVDISQYLIDDESVRRMVEETADREHARAYGPDLN